MPGKAISGDFALGKGISKNPVPEKSISRNAILGKSMFQASVPVESKSGQTVIKAQVKPENQVSNKIFIKAGYEVYSISYQKIL